MSRLFEEMAQGTAEARAYMEGERNGYKVTLPGSIDVRGIRKRLHFSQGRFADAFGLSVDAVRHWESGRRNPEAAARALLMVIAHDPQLVMRALAQSLPSTPAPARAGKRLEQRAAEQRDHPLRPEPGGVNSGHYTKRQKPYVSGRIVASGESRW